MKKLSISTAWDMSRDQLAKHGSLYFTIMGALVMLPVALQTTIAPATAEDGGGIGFTLLLLATSILSVIAMVSVASLAVGSEDRVGAAIRRGAIRFLPAMAAGLLWGLPMILLLFFLFGWTLGPENMELIASGSDDVTPDMIDTDSANPIGSLLILVLGFVLLWLGTRLGLVMPLAAAEDTGPVGLLTRSWALTKGHFWRIFATTLLLGVAYILIGGALSLIAGLFINLVASSEPMTVGAMLSGLVAGAIQAVFLTVFALMLVNIYRQLAATPAATASPPETSMPPTA